jgi:hypothetical protein
MEAGGAVNQTGRATVVDLSARMPNEVERFLLREYPGGGIAKHRGLFQLAKALRAGCIVELGVWRGKGLIALACGSAYGSHVPVYGVDSWQETVIDGRLYTPRDRLICVEKLLRLKANGAGWTRPPAVDVRLVGGDVVEEAISWCGGPIGLIHWDVGEHLGAHFEAWKLHLVPGGVFAIHDTRDRRFRSDLLLDRAVKEGFEVVAEDDKASLYVVRRLA